MATPDDTAVPANAGIHPANNGAVERWVPAFVRTAEILFRDTFQKAAVLVKLIEQVGGVVGCHPRKHVRRLGV